MAAALVLAAPAGAADWTAGSPTAGDPFNGNVTTEDFIALAEAESGQQLDTYFDIWLFQPTKPVPGSW